MRFTTIRKQLGLGCSGSLRDMVRLAVALVLASGWGCATRQDDAQKSESTQACTSVPPVVAPEVVLGFEALDAWRASAGRESLSLVRTQGSEALALTNPASETDLTSARLASTAAGLVGITATGATISLDVMLPAQLAKVKDLGSLQLFVSCPSRGLANANLGSVDFKGARLGIYRTVKFAVSDKVQRALKGAKYQDLTFDLKLHAPAKASGAYLFDNMRLGSPATPPPTPAASIDLVATTAYSPAATTPGIANFPVGVVQVPQSFHVNLGSAGTGTATLALGYTNGSIVTCTYVGATGGTSYVLSSCTGGAQAGDLLGADFAQLTIVSGDPTAGTTRIRAQLAENPAGDVTGGGVIPPMPTFWGDTPASANQIATDYFNAVNAAPPTGGQQVQAPVGDFAKRTGDPTPFDVAQGPPPPNDPDFHKGAHMNNGGAWDGYWSYDTYLVYDEHYNLDDTNPNTFPTFDSNTKTTSPTPTPDPPDHRTMQFISDFSVHAVLWGNDIELSRMAAHIQTDSGLVGKTGFDPTAGSASGSVAVYLLGNEVAGSSINPSDGSTNLSLPGDSDEYNLPPPLSPIEIWIFTIEIGAVVDAGITVAKLATSDAILTGLPDLVFTNTTINAKVSPHATIGAHVSASINLGVASGGVDAQITLLQATLPVVTQGSWTFLPTCTTTFSYALSGEVTSSSLGGEVDLVAEFGACPFCWHDRWTIFKWDPLNETTKPLFISFDRYPVVAQLPATYCWQCTPNEYFCSTDSTGGDTRVPCDSNGQPQTALPCPNGCQDGLCNQPPSCTPDSDYCLNGDSVHCDDSGTPVQPSTPCSDCGCVQQTGLCVNYQTDDNNCGACGNKCVDGLHCSGGACVCNVPPAGYGTPCGSCGGTITCDGTCSVATPPNLGADCWYDCGGGTHNYGGQCYEESTIGCDGNCSPPSDNCSESYSSC